MKNSQDDFASYKIGYFISPHGYGHAARSSAVMAAMLDINPSIRFEIFTTVPKWFFQQSLTESFNYHSVLTDIGLVQNTPLCEDLPETLCRLNDFLPFDNSQIKELSETINRTKCQLIICDISPMGIVAAQTAQVPSVLIENFTWDWVYKGYVGPDFPVDQHVNYLRNIFNSANYHIQTGPACCPHNADLTTSPVSRKKRTSPEQVRERLGIPDDVKVVMITMGGIPEHFTFLKQLKHQRDIFFIIPGGSKSEELVDNLILLPHHSNYFHPDLINACDAVIGKLGYSTLAEIYYAGVPYGYIPRRDFKESEVLEKFIKNEMSGCAIMESHFRDGSWVSILPELLALPKMKRNNQNGATHAAQFIYNIKR